jgi:hypothetical protein
MVFSMCLASCCFVGSPPFGSALWASALGWAFALPFSFLGPSPFGSAPWASALALDFALPFGFAASVRGAPPCLSAPSALDSALPFDFPASVLATPGLFATAASELWPLVFPVALGLLTAGSVTLGFADALALGSEISDKGVDALGPSVHNHYRFPTGLTLKGLVSSLCLSPAETRSCSLIGSKTFSRNATSGSHWLHPEIWHGALASNRRFLALGTTDDAMDNAG